MSSTVKLIVGLSSSTTTVEQITSVSKMLAESINVKSKTIRVVSRYSEEVNAEFIGYLTGSLPVFNEKCIVEVASLFEQYRCESLLKSAVEFISSNVPLERILSEYLELTRSGNTSPVFEKILLDSVVTPQTILFEEPFMGLPVELIEHIFSAKSDVAIPQSLVFAFILKEIELKQQGVEPLMRFLDYRKLVLPQLMDLKETLLKNQLFSLAYLVIQMIRIKSSYQITRRMSRFETILESSVSFNVEYQKCREFNGVFKMLEKCFGANLISCGAVAFSSSSNDPNQIIGMDSKSIWVSGNETDPFFQINSDTPIKFNQYKFTGSKNSKPRTYSIQVSNDGQLWNEIAYVEGKSGIQKLASKMGKMTTTVHPPKQNTVKVLSEECEAMHIRLTNYGKNGKGTNKVALTSFELFYNGSPILGPLKADPNKHISVSSSSCSYPSLLDTDKGGFWCSLNIPKSFVQLTFQGFGIAITGYTLQTYEFDKGMNHLKQWVVLGSLDGQKWIELDRQDPNEDLNGSSMFRYYKCKNPRPCRHMRIQIDGENHHAKNILVLSSIEVFGSVLPDLP